MTDPSWLTISALAPRVASGERRSEQLTEDALSTIQTLNPSLNAFITVMAEDALAAARDADKEIAAGRYRGPLHGIPLSIKDLIDVAGVPTTAASRLREGRVAAHDAPVVRHLRDAGAVIVGKTNLHEFALGTTNEDSAWGPARHPIDPMRSPGGSSGGSAIAVRTGMSVASVGSDTGGSIRIPAAACGIVGLKPSTGDVSAQGVVPLSRQLDHVGPLARSVADAAMMFDALRGAAPGAPLERRAVKGLRIALLEDYFLDRVGEDVEAQVRAAVDRLRTAGAEVSTASLPHAKYIAPIYVHLVLADGAAYHAATLEKRPAAYTPNVRLRLEMGRNILAEDYLRALRGKAVLRQEIDRALSDVDALVLPALAIEAPPLGAASVPVKGGSEPVRNIMLRCTQPFNISGHPAVSLPCGVSRLNLPIGLQIVGRRQQTHDLLAIAAGIEHALATT